MSWRSRFSSIISWLDRLHFLWLAAAAPFMLFPSPKRSLAMLVVPALWILHWLAVRGQEAGGRRQLVGNDRSTPHAPPTPLTPTPLTPTPPSPIPLTPLNSTLLLMALMVLVSEWATFDLAYSLPKISGMVLVFGIFFAAAREGAGERGRWWSLLAFFLAGLGIAGLGLLGTNWATTKIAFLSPIVARLPKLIAGLQGAESGFHPNEVAGALVWVLPAMLAVSVGLFFSPQHFVKTLPVSRKKPPQMNTDSHRPVRKYPRSSVFIRGSKTDAGGIASRWRWVLTAVLCLLATLFVGAVFLLTQSRSGYIGLALTLPLLVLPALPPRWRWVCLIVFVALAIALGFVVASRWEAIRAWLTGSDLASDPALSLNTLEGRLEIWSRAIYGIQDFPFTGMGMNAFRRVVSVLYPLFLVSPDSDIGHAHNEFLQAALDLGLPGLIAFLALYIIAFWMLADLWKRTSPSNLLTPNSLTPNSLAPNSLTPTSQPATINLQRAVILGLGGGLLAHLLYGLTDAVALGAKPGLLFWMLLGLIAGLHERAHVQNALPA